VATPLIVLRGLTRRFVTGAETVTVLDDINLDIEAGEMIAIVGQSGSGKSTLMNILGCLDRASEGSYTFAGRDISRLSPDDLAELRRENFGSNEEPYPRRRQFDTGRRPDFSRYRPACT